MKEDKLQFDCVTWFHNTYPQHRGMLFEINNKTNKGSYRKGLGLVKGASDLAYLDITGHMFFMELKTNGSRHSVKHLKEQLDWIYKTQSRGSYCFFVFTFEQFQEIFEHYFVFGNTIAFKYMQMKSLGYISNLIESATTATVKIDYNVKES